MPSINIEKIDEIIEEFLREKEFENQGRKYAVRIDQPQTYKPNPSSYGDIKSIAPFLYDNFKSLMYFYALYGESEEGKTVLFVYLEFNNGTRELTIQNRMPRCKITRVCGSREEILKQMYTICEDTGYVECDSYEKQFNR